MTELEEIVDVAQIEGRANEEMVCCINPRGSGARRVPTEIVKLAYTFISIVFRMLRLNQEA
jgi:hypothetical protein